MTRVRVTTSGLERLQTKITRRANFLGSSEMQSLMQEEGSTLVESFKRRIESFTPGEVPDLAESTKKQKQKQVGFIYPILKRTSRMMESMYARVRRPAGGSGWIIAIGFAGSQNGVPNARIAEIHINGEGKMPKRDFTKIPSEWKRDLMDRIREELASL